MADAFLTRKVQFSAAHRYFRPNWSEEENRRVFGACANPHGHGHTYLLEVTVRAEVAVDTGFSVDLGALDALLRTEVTERLDHQHLNHVIPEFRDGGDIPTSENILIHLWPRIEAGLPAGAELTRLRLHEDPGFYVDYFGGATRATP
jgi:6-pyruvoyltetrahydropterin/6-carboxytetrahydropterin synthase